MGKSTDRLQLSRTHALARGMPPGTAVTLRRLGGALVLSLAALTVGGCAAALNAFTSNSGYSLVKDIRYASHDRGVYDLYIPEEVNDDTPVIVFIHGGNWESGSKDVYLFVGQSLASAGMIVAIPNYRLFPEVIFPAFVEDAAQAVGAVTRTVRGGAYGMPGGRHPVILMGHSAGAQIAALLATDAIYLERHDLSPASLAGFVGLAGPYDFLPLKEERYKRIFPEPLRAASQPVNFVNGDEPPMLLIAGAADETVDPENTRSLARQVEAAGGTASIYIVPEVDHIGAVTAFATAFDLSDPSIRRRTLKFIDAHAG